MAIQNHQKTTEKRFLFKKQVKKFNLTDKKYLIFQLAKYLFLSDIRPNKI